MSRKKSSAVKSPERELLDEIEIKKMAPQNALGMKFLFYMSSIVDLEGDLGKKGVNTEQIEAKIKAFKDCKSKIADLYPKLGTQNIEQLEAKLMDIDAQLPDSAMKTGPQVVTRILRTLLIHAQLTDTTERNLKRSFCSFLGLQNYDLGVKDSDILQDVRMYARGYNSEQDPEAHEWYLKKLLLCAGRLGRQEIEEFNAIRQKTTRQVAPEQGIE